MPTPMKVEKIWLTDTAVWIRSDDGREAYELLSDYPRLKHASTEQLHDFEADEYGIHWDELDEDLRFEGFSTNSPRQPRNPSFFPTSSPWLFSIVFCKINSESGGRIY